MEIKNCRFCNIKSGQYLYQNIDEPVFQDNNIMVFASIGSLVEGWTIVCSKEHQNSLISLYEKQEFIDSLKIVINKFKQRYSKILIFEHGSNSEDSLTGCGINHSHLHIVPYNISLVQNSLFDYSLWQRTKIIDLKTKCKDNEYHLYGELEGEFDLETTDFWVKKVLSPESQFFRKVIANDLGVSDYNYNSNCCLEKSRKTHEILSNLFK